MSKYESQEEQRLMEADGSLIASQRTMWGMMGLGLAIGLLGMNLLVANPMLDEISRLQREVTLLQQDVQELVGVRGQVRETGNLLSSIQDQRKLVEQAQAGLNAIRTLQNDMIQQAKQSVSAHHALEEMITLQDKVLDQREHLVPAQQAMDDISKIQASLVNQEGQASIAQNSVQSLLDLKNKILEYTADLSSAQVALTDLIGLKNLVLVQGGETEVARKQAQDLMQFQKDLAQQSTQIETASRNLQMLLQLKDKLASQTKDIADAIQNMDLLTSFRDDFQKQISTLENMRQGLMEIVMMETTLGRVTRMLEPLVQLGTRRGLSEVEIREAARKILEQRNTNVSQKVESLDKPTLHKEQTESLKADGGLVPQPKD